MWDELPRCCSLIHPKGLEQDIVKAVEDGKIMEVIADLNFVNRQLARPVKEVLDELNEDEDYSFVSEKDVYSLEGWVGVSFSEHDYEMDSVFSNYIDKLEDDDDDFENVEGILPSLPLKKESHIGRNHPCPCGSGKKYKKCCGK